MKTTPEVFDFAIVGAGAAGLHLAQAMMEDSFFRNKKILIIDKAAKDVNDKTWCYWETGKGKWDKIAHKIWEKGYFVTNNRYQLLEMGPFKYKMLRAIDFYNHAKQQILLQANFKWVQEEVLNIVDGANVKIECEKHSFQAIHVFDSRIDKEFFQNKDSSIRILQHFKGWMIETVSDVFNPDEFVMMDFRLKWKESASFTYVLPTSKRKALVEFTLFTPELINDADYDLMLKSYVENILKVKDYKITEVEQGVIPMTNYPFHKKSSAYITKIGTAGSWVKPSSGYSFKNSERFAAKVVSNIKNGRVPSKGIGTNRHRKYDSIFLDVLKNKNELGEKIFTAMYLKNPAYRIFRFLDEKTTLAEDLKIIASFESAPFIASFFNVVKKSKIVSGF
ncbi:MAG: lycopene cyclase [Bacteroidetes bacterium]|nr:lycopene cyclase [Bacteroidota bacterium]